MAGSLCNAVGGVRSVAPPAQSSIADWYRGADLVDSFATTFGAGISRDPEAVAHAILGRPAWWVRGLLATRDMTVARFGLKTTGELQRNAPDRKSISFFPILARSESELVLGVDDRHLDFRASILLGALNDEDAFEVVVTTVVHCHNIFGRAYLALIKPFHILIVRSNLSRAVQARNGEVQSSSTSP